MADIIVKPYTMKSLISRRESEVLHLIAYEFTTIEIADMLYISYNTAHSHRKSMLNKLKVKNSAGLIRRAFELGLLQANDSFTGMASRDVTFSIGYKVV